MQTINSNLSRHTRFQKMASKVSVRNDLDPTVSNYVSKHYGQETD